MAGKIFYMNEGQEVQGLCKATVERNIGVKVDNS